MNDDFLEHAEKTCKQFATGFRSLAKLCALAVVSTKKMGRKSPESVEEKSEPGQKVPEPLQKVPEPLQKVMTVHGKVMPTNHDWIVKSNPPFPRDEEQAAFLGSQACVWGAYFVQSGIRYLVGKMVRSDRYGNQWVYDPTYKKRKGWRGISPKQYDKLCSHVCLFVSCCQHLVKKYRTAEEFEAKVCKVNKYQWARRNIFLEGRESTCGMTEFQKWTRNTHKELKPLR